MLYLSRRCIAAVGRREWDEAADQERERLYIRLSPIAQREFMARARTLPNWDAEQRSLAGEI
jgi:hypothetical protein